MTESGSHTADIVGVNNDLLVDPSAVIIGTLPAFLLRAHARTVGQR